MSTSEENKSAKDKLHNDKNTGYSPASGNTGGLKDDDNDHQENKGGKPESGSKEPDDASTKPSERDASSYGYSSEKEAHGKDSTSQEDQEQLKKEHADQSSTPTPKHDSDNLDSRDN